MRNQAISSVGGQRMAAMNFAGLRLAVPLVEVNSLVSVLDLDDSRSGASILSSVEVNGQELPAFGFDAELDLLRSVPDDYRVCVNLGDDNPELGILCQSVETLEQPVTEEALPVCMSSDHSMVTGLALNDGEILLCTNLSALVEYIAMMDKSNAGPFLRSSEAN